MKKLLTLLIFVSINCKAQTGIFKTIETHGITIQDLLDYTVDCYNDSSFVNVQIKPNGWCNSTNNYGGTTCMHCPAVYENRWVHEHKATFEGFTKYLIKKYGK